MSRGQHGCDSQRNLAGVKFSVTWREHSNRRRWATVEGQPDLYHLMCRVPFLPVCGRRNVRSGLCRLRPGLCRLRLRFTMIDPNPVNKLSSLATCISR